MVVGLTRIMKEQFQISKRNVWSCRTRKPVVVAVFNEASCLRHRSRANRCRRSLAAAVKQQTFVTTMALELLSKRFMAVASGLYKKSLTKELNRMGE